MKKLLLIVMVLMLTGCIKSGSSARDLGHNYTLMTTAGSEEWSIWGRIPGKVGNGFLIIWYKVAKIGVNDQYIVGQRVQGTSRFDLDIVSKNPQPYGYFIINKYTDEKIMGLTEEEAKEKFADINISMDLLEGTSRSYHWKGEKSTLNQ